MRVDWPSSVPERDARVDTEAESDDETGAAAEVGAETEEAAPFRAKALGRCPIRPLVAEAGLVLTSGDPGGESS
jgi:hypothetical protein